MIHAARKLRIPCDIPRAQRTGRLSPVSCMASESAACHGVQFSSVADASGDRQSSAQEATASPELGDSVDRGGSDGAVEMSSALNGGLQSPAGLATPEIERKYVHRVYDAIAPHFSATRFAKWPRVAEFLDSLQPGSVVLDVGCGNGKYLGLNPRCIFMGCDISAPLVSICAKRGHEVLVADALNIPYRSDICDAAISIAVLHHLSTEQRRKRAITELLRVVRPGGKVLITVWALEQENPSLLSKWTPLTRKYMEEWVRGSERKLKRSGSSSSLGSIKEMSREDMIDDEQTPRIQEDLEELDLDLDDLSIPAGDYSGEQPGAPRSVPGDQREYFVPWHLPYHRAETGGASAAAVASGFARKDDKKGAVVYDRYYHVFSEGELERLVAEVSGALLVHHFFDKSNWCVILQKQ